MSLRTHKPIVAALERFAKEHLDNPKSPIFARQQARFLELLAIKQKEWLEEHENEGAYGMSSAGGCLLKQDHRRDGVAGAPPEGHTRTTWHHGHLVEVELLSMLEVIGCKVEGLQAPVRTYRADGTLLHSSKVDGIIVEAPADLGLPLPVIVSCKSTAYKNATFVKGGSQERRGFAALPFGVRQEEPSWFLQAQLEMHGSGTDDWSGAVEAPDNLPECRNVLLVAMAKDVVEAYSQDSILQESGSLAFYAELIPYEEPIARTLCQYREALDHIAAVPVLTPDPPEYLRYIRLPEPGSAGGQKRNGWSIWGGPNQAATGTYNTCGRCEYRLACAKKGGAA